MAKKEVVQVLVSPNVKMQVAEIADRQGLSVSAWVRQLILKSTKAH